MTYGYDETGQPKSLIDLRPMDVGDVLDGTIRVYRAVPFIFIGIMAVIASVPLLIQQSSAQYFTVILEKFMELMTVAEDDPEIFSMFQTTEFYTAAGIFGLGSFLMFFFGPLAQAATVHAVSETILGRKTSIGESIRAILPKAGRIILAYILLGLIILVCYTPIIIVIIAGASDPDRYWMFLLLFPILFLVMAVLLFLSVKFLFIPHSVVLDDTGALEAFGRSFQLTSGYWWRTFGINMLVGIIVSVIAYMLGGLVNLVNIGLKFIPGIDDFMVIVFGGLLLTVISVVIQPITIIAVTLLYYDLRIRKEGFDILHLASALAPSKPDRPVDFTPDAPYR